mgnify:CR=1 FL=1
MAATIDITGELLLRQKANDTSKPTVNSQPVNLAKTLNVTRAFDKYYESFGIQTDLELMSADSLSEAISVFFQASAVASLKINGAATAIVTDYILIVSDPASPITSLKLTTTGVINFYLFMGR